MNDYLNKDMNYGSSGRNPWLYATEAHKIACDSCEIQDTAQMNEIMKKIHENAQKGEIQLYWDKLRMNVKNSLNELGYKITHSSDQRDGDYYLIEW